MKTARGSSIDEHCGNCSATFGSASQIFTSITVVDDTNCSKIQEIAILDAILYIYGFSATNLATAFLDYEGDDHLFTFNEVTETSDYIIEHGLPFCSNCVSIFKEVYVAVHQLKKLADGSSVLNKATKKFAPTCIKIETDSEENKDRNFAGEDCTRVTRSAANNVCLQKTFPEKSTLEITKAESGPDEDLFQAFQFENEYADPGESDQEEDIKTELIGESILTNVDMTVSSSCIPTDSHTNINDGVVNTSSQPIEKRKVCRSRGGSSKNRKQIGKSDSGYKKTDRPKKCDPKPPEDIGSQRPVSLRIHLARRSTSKTEIEDTVQYKRRPKVKRILTKEQKEKPKTYSKTEERAEILQLLLTGKTAKEIFKLLKKSGVKRSNVYRVVKRYKETGSANDRERSGPPIKPTPAYHLSSENKIICDKCKKSFSSLRTLRIHNEIHESEGLDKELFRCKECGILLKNSKNLKKHILVTHKNPKTFLCPECGKTTKNMTNMRYHMKVHDPNRFLKIKLPNSTAESTNLPLETYSKKEERAEILRLHLNGKTANDIFKLLKNSGVKRTTVFNVVKRYKETGSVSDRKRSGRPPIKPTPAYHLSSENKFICDKCKKSFISLKTLRIHNETHESESIDKELFRCKECGVLLKSSRILKMHILVTHKNPKTFLCPECGKTTKNMTNMRYHMKVHDPNRFLKTKQTSSTAESTNLPLDKEKPESAIIDIGSDVPS